MAGVGHSKRICKDEFFVAGAIDKCSSLYDLASFFRGSRNRLDKWIGQIARRIAFLMLSTSKNEEVSQNCFVFKLADCS